MATLCHLRIKSLNQLVLASLQQLVLCPFNSVNLIMMPYKFPPSQKFNSFNDHALLGDEDRVILPRHKKLALLRHISVSEGACNLCFDKMANTMLKPCEHKPPAHLQGGYKNSKSDHDFQLQSA
ncbi:RING finger and SPRY domain-containing protein 1-like isoform X1 [Glandiceps talaboti]